MINEALAQQIFEAALSFGGDFAEIFLEDNFSTTVTTIGGHLEKGMSGRDYGLGLRILNGLDSIYVYTSDLSREHLLEITRKAARAVGGKGERFQSGDAPSGLVIQHPFRILPQDVLLKQKIVLARQATEAARNCKPEITQVSVNYLDQDQRVLIANSEGLFREDRRVRTRMLIRAAAEANGQMEESYVGPGAMRGFEFYESIDVEEQAREAARSASTMVYADYSPSGVMPVVTDNGFGGLLFHEACGHSLEASSVAKGISVFSGKKGQSIASELVTLIDDGSMPNEWGSLGMDDEGSPTRRNVLIEKGILSNFMVDKLNGRRMGEESTASARRQSYRFAPTSRMFNTYIDNGTSTREEIIAATEYGLFAKRLNAGSVNPATGEFNFSLSEAYLIENGKITKPVKAATLIGNGRDILKDVDMVGNNLKIGQGYCFAGSGALFIGAGQPTLRVKAMTVGGRKD